MNKKNIVINFQLSIEDIEKVDIWKKSLKPLEEDINDLKFQFEYIFYPTGLGVIKKVRRVDGKEIDLTDYNLW